MTRSWDHESFLCCGFGLFLYLVIYIRVEHGIVARLLMFVFPLAVEVTCVVMQDRDFPLI